MSKIRMLGCIVTSTAILGYGCGVNDGEDFRETEPEVDIEVTRNDVISGSSNWSGRELIRNRTASIYNAGCSDFDPGESASGTFLNRYVVLTAKHVVTDNCLVSGNVVDPADVRVRIGAMAPAPSGNDICVGPNTTDCSIAQVITVHPTLDLAVIELDNKIVPGGALAGFYPFTPIPLILDQATYMPSPARVLTGWGLTTCGGPQDLRWGLVDTQVLSTNSSLLRLTGKVPEGQMTANGDSGGPLWADNLAGTPQIGVHSGSFGCQTPHYGDDVSLIHHSDTSVFNLLKGVLTDYEFTYEVPVDASKYQTVDVNPADTAPNWTVSAGRFAQTVNAGLSFAIVKDRAVHLLNDLEAKVTVQGSDNDSSGLVMSYTDPQNYIACYADDQNNVAKMVAVRAGVETVWSSKPWAGSYANDVTFTLRSTAQGQILSISCTIAGGGTSTVAVGMPSSSSILGGPFGGMVGIYNNFNQVTHRDVVVEMLN